MGMGKSKKRGLIMTQNKQKIKTEILLNAHDIIARAIEEGINYGYRRAYKHSNKPSEDTIKMEVYNSVMSHLGEVLMWNNNE